MKRLIVILAAGAFVGSLLAARIGSAPTGDDVSGVRPLFRHRQTTREVDIDIKPWSNPNPINLKSEGVIAVAVLTTSTFDATQVDPDTVTFAGATPIRWVLEDVGVSPEVPDGEPLPPDGDLDMLFFFDKQDLNVVQGQTTAMLKGRTLDGQPFWGEDTIKVLGGEEADPVADGPWGF